MKEFPHLVQMHKKYGPEGFVAVSVSLDNAKDKEVVDEVNKFLRKKEAAGMTNLIAEDNAADWYEKDKLNAGGLPLVFVFDRDNRRVKKLADKVDYKEIEAEVVRLLKK
jgi:hypothetical protein